MWVAIGAVISTVIGVIFSLAKASSRAEREADRHREELLARKQRKSTEENREA